jgi:RNA polymerase sigma-32 factor
MFDNSDYGFQQYLAAIERYPVLDRERELDLARRYQDGDEAAGDELVRCSLRYVSRIATRYRGYGFRLGELVAEGNIGLLQAVRRFAPERGLRFMTYASYWVRAHVLTYILKHWSLVGIGTGPMQSKLFFRLNREKGRLSAQLGEGVDLTPHLARTFSCSEERIRKMEQRLDRRDLSLDAKLFQEGPATVIDSLVDDAADQETAVWREELSTLVRQRVSAALERLDAREQTIARRRLLGSKKETLSVLGRELGLSRERVRQLENRVKTKLRHTLADLAPRHTPYMQAA